MTTLAAVAGRTRRIKFGVNVVSVAMREPVLLAKQCATIDVLSNGRLLPGFGIGSPRGAEWTSMHLDNTTRGRKTDEALEIISRLWTGAPLDYEGKHFRLTGASIAPVPVQPDLPMWIGGSSDAAIRRTARLGTGWQAGPETPQTVGEVIAGIKRALAETGRTIDEDHYGAAFAFRFGGPDDPGVARVMEQYKARTGRDPAESVRDGGRGGYPAPALGIHRGRRVKVHSAPEWHRAMGRCWRRRNGWWKRCCPRLPRAGQSSVKSRPSSASSRRTQTAAGQSCAALRRASSTSLSVTVCNPRPGGIRL